MVLLSVLALLLFGASVALLLRAVALPRLKAAERIRGIELYGFNARTAPTIAAAPESGPALSALAGAVGAFAARRLRNYQPEEVRALLVSAGLYRVSSSALLGYRVLGVLVVGGSGLMLASNASIAGGLVVAGLCAALGWMAPLILVRRLAQRRLATIDRELPDLIDLMVVTVEAGSGLAQSLQLAMTRLEGPVAQELRIVLQEQRMGRSLAEALTGMLGRCDTPNVRSFVRSITQGETLGVSIASIMRNLAAEMRDRRRAAAQEQAQKAPVKMLFPLVFLILPAFILIILGPALFELSKALT